MNTASPYSVLARDGLWHNNPALVQWLGLCPLAAVSTTVVYGLALGIATLCILLISNSLISALRRLIPAPVRIPAYVLAIATAVSAVDLLMQAYYPVLYQRLGLFIPLIITNCVILARAETLASKTNIRRAAVDALAMGAGFMLVLGALGGLRELAADGGLFSQAELLFGPAGENLKIELFPHAHRFLLAALPPGAFLGLALLIALYQSINQRFRRPAAMLLPALNTP